MCDVRTATVITFIFRISTRPFPLRLHILQQGRGCFFCFYFFFSSLKLSKFCLSFTPNAAPADSLKITYHRDSPLSLPLHGFSFFSLFLPKKGGWQSVDGASLCGERQGGRWGIQILTCSCLSPSRSAAAFSPARLYSPHRVCGCVATSKHFFHACLSSARRLGPPTVNLPARCAGQTRAIFLRLYCQTEANSGKTLPVDLWSLYSPQLNVNKDQTFY